MRASWGERRARRLVAIRQFVHTHAHDPSLRPQDCAKALGISVRSLHLALSRTEVRFTELVAHTRLTRCASQLNGPDKPATVMDVAFECGFGSMATFYRVFKRQFGGCPSELRNHRNNPDLRTS